MDSSVSAPGISEKVILSLYEKVLPILYSESEELHPIQELKERLAQITPFDFLTYIIEGPEAPEHNDILSTRIEEWPENKDTEKPIRYTVETTKSSDPDDSFEEKVKTLYRQSIERRIESKLDAVQEYNHLLLVSREDPKLAIYFFRAKDHSVDNTFTIEEKSAFDKLSSHIFLIFRVSISPSFHTQTFSYFDAYTAICSRIAHDYHLSDTELKLLPEILFGRTNAEIADRNYISLPTVKKHIQHIFKKTNTKNRVDFMSKFFTSPERASL